jgi:hypothetical protein
LIGTIAISHGIDLDVSLVIVVGAHSCNLLELVQVAGRAGRSSDGGRCVLLYSENQLSTPSPVIDFINYPGSKQDFLSQQMDGFSPGSASPSSLFFQIGTSSLLDQQEALVLENQAQLKLEQVFDRLQTDVCFICSEGVHSLSICPLWRGRCFGCGRKNVDHPSSRCPLRPLIQSAAVKEGICFRCCLPPTIYQHNCGPMGTNCRWPDTLLPAALMRLADNKTNPSDIPQLLCSLSQGLPNIINICF